jgi:DNA sulfur modification protein DndD
MKIRRLEVKDYRQYQDLRLEMADDRSDVVLIVGSNGTGKTNLLNSIIWCLYGREQYYARNQDSSPLVNQKSLDETADGDILTVEVMLDLEFANGMEVEIRRCQDFVKRGKQGSPRGPSVVKVLPLEEKARGTKPEGNPEHWLEKHVPHRLEPYFLFDGERLDSFFRHAEAKHIKDAVLQIAQIDLLGSLKSHLEKVATPMYSAAGRATGQGRLEEMAKELERQQGLLDTAIEGVTLKRESVDACSEAVRVAEAKWGDLKTVVVDIKRRKDLEDSAKRIDQKLKESWADLQGWAVKAGPAILTHKALTGFVQMVDEARKQRRIPPPMDPIILRQLLEEGFCVCETALDEGSKHRHAIEGLLLEYEHVGEIGAQLLAYEPGARAALSRAQNSVDTVNAIMRRIDDYEQQREEVAKDLELLHSRLAGHVDTEVQQNEAQLSKAKADLVEVNKELWSVEHREEELRAAIDKLERDLEKAESEVDAGNELMKKARFAKRCLRVAESIYDDLTDEVRTRVSETLEEHFRKMMWKQNSIASVTIDQDYSVSVRNKRGYEILPDLAAGERECLALAFSLALSEVSGYELPMVIDTPMGRLNPDVQTFVAGVLAEHTKDPDGVQNHQLIMLMTETEYNKDVAAVLASRSPHVYKIQFDEADTTSRLVEVS